MEHMGIGVLTKSHRSKIFREKMGKVVYCTCFGILAQLDDPFLDESV